MWFNQMLAIHSISNRFHNVPDDFDYSTFTALRKSLYKYVSNNKCYCLTLSLVTCGASLTVQVANDSIGYAIMGKNETTYSQAVTPGVIGVASFYPFGLAFHQISALAFKKLSANDQKVVQNVLKHLLSLSHDFVSSLAYTSIGDKINTNNINYAINIGAPIFTFFVICIVLLTEKIIGKSVFTSNESLKPMIFSRCCNYDVSDKSNAPANPRTTYQAV
jgi:hypothetical protein